MIKLIKILYIHGLGSSSQSSTGKYFASRSNSALQFFNPSFSLSPLKALEEINNFIKENEIDIVIGSSLGGFYALQCDCKYGVVINPALTPIKDIEEAIGYGEHPYVNGEGTYVIDDNFFDELRKIIARNYDGRDPDKWFEYFTKRKFFAGLFGKKDELFQHSFDFKYIGKNIIVVDEMKHRFEEKYFDQFNELLATVIVKFLSDTLTFD